MRNLSSTETKWVVGAAITAAPDLVSNPVRLPPTPIVIPPPQPPIPVVIQPPWSILPIKPAPVAVAV
jgi:hypothetical protein